MNPIVTALKVLGISIPEHRYIKADAFERFFRNRKLLSVVIDTRPTHAYRRGHLTSAIHMPAPALLRLSNLNQIRDQVFKRKTNWLLFVYAADTAQTEALKMQLEAKCKGRFGLFGPPAIYYLKGGLQAGSKTMQTTVPQE